MTITSMYAPEQPLLALNVHRPTRLHRGFTLIEMMIVVAVIGILAAIAYPSYQSSVLKGRRAEARTALAELMQQQERHATQNNTYMVFTKGAADVPFKTYTGNGDMATSHYLLSAEACGDDANISDCVLLKAFPQHADPEVGVLTYNSLGIKSCEPQSESNAPVDSRLCWP